jgi:DnaJ-class molecular chaperone
MEYQIRMFLSAWIVLGIVIGIILIRHFSRKTKSSNQLCKQCNGMGFIMSANNDPPPCLNCNGIGYL